MVEKEDSRGLAEAIEFLLNNPDTARQMGQAGRSRMTGALSLENFVDAYDTLYQRLIREANKVHAASYA